MDFWAAASYPFASGNGCARGVLANTSNRQRDNNHILGPMQWHPGPLYLALAVAVAPNKGIQTWLSAAHGHVLAPATAISTKTTRTRMVGCFKI